MNYNKEQRVIGEMYLNEVQGVGAQPNPPGAGVVGPAATPAAPAQQGGTHLMAAIQGGKVDLVKLEALAIANKLLMPGPTVPTPLPGNPAPKTTNVLPAGAGPTVPTPGTTAPAGQRNRA